jgi:hypothetical protein
VVDRAYIIQSFQLQSETASVFLNRRSGVRISPCFDGLSDRCGALSVSFCLGGFGDTRLRHLFFHAGEYGLVRLLLGFVVRHMLMMSCGQKQCSSIQHSFILGPIDTNALSHDRKWASVIRFRLPGANAPGQKSEFLAFLALLLSTRPTPERRLEPHWTAENGHLAATREQFRLTGSVKSATLLLSMAVYSAPLTAVLRSNSVSLMQEKLPSSASVNGIFGLA